MLSGCLGAEQVPAVEGDPSTVRVRMALATMGPYEVDGLELEPLAACAAQLSGNASLRTVGAYPHGSLDDMVCSFPGPLIVVPDDSQVTLELEAGAEYFQPNADVPWNQSGTPDMPVITFYAVDEIITLAMNGSLGQLGLVTTIVPESIDEKNSVVVAGHLHAPLVLRRSPASLFRVCAGDLSFAECISVPPAAPDLFLVNGGLAPAPFPQTSHGTVIVNHGVTTLEIQPGDQEPANDPTTSIPSGTARVFSPMGESAGVDAWQDVGNTGSAWWGSLGPMPLLTESSAMGDATWQGRPLPNLPNGVPRGYENTSTATSQIDDEIQLDLPFPCALEEVRFVLVQTGESSPGDLTGFDVRILDHDGQEIHSTFVPHGEDWEYSWYHEDLLDQDAVPQTWEITERGGTGTRISGGASGFYDHRWDNHFHDESRFRCLVEQL